MNITSKLPEVGTTIFTTMTKMALEHNAINIAQGFPNFPVDEKLIQLYQKAIVENIHQYAPMPGNLDLINTLVDLTLKNYQRTINAQEVLITAGATQAIFTSIQALVNENDEVIVFEPAYDCYVPALDLVKAKTIGIEMNRAFEIDWNDVSSKISKKTKMIILNNPHNPSGTVLKEKDFLALETLFEKHPQLLLLSDEVYEYISFEQKHISVNTRPKLKDRAIITSSFGKTFHITGWKIGYLLAPEYVMTEIKKVHQFLVFSVNSVSQYVLNNYLQETDVRALSSFYQQKRDFFRNLLLNSRFELLPCEGSYFQTVSYQQISSENDLDFTIRLVKEFGVSTIPMSVFYKNKTDYKQIRLCFAKDDETLYKAAEKLSKV